MATKSIGYGFTSNATQTPSAIGNGLNTQSMASPARKAEKSGTD